MNPGCHVVLLRSLLSVAVFWIGSESTAGVMTCYRPNSCILVTLYFLIECSLNLTSFELSTNFSTNVAVISRGKLLSCVLLLVPKVRSGHHRALACRASSNDPGLWIDRLGDKWRHRNSDQGCVGWLKVCPIA